MFDRFTERARKVMTLARQEAQKLNNDYIGTEHILLGLVQEGSGVAAQVLKNLHVDLPMVRAQVDRIVERGKSPTAERMLPFTPRAKRVLEHALKEAQNLGHNYIGSEHLLLGLIRESDGPAAHVLQILGVKPEEVREEVIELIGAEPPAGAATPGEEDAPSPPPERAEARALVEALLLTRARGAAPSLFEHGGAKLEVTCSHGPKGWATSSGWGTSARTGRP